MTSWLVSLSWLYFMLLEDYILYSVHIYIFRRKLLAGW